MAKTSSYLKYLPAVLWSSQPAVGGFSLGTMLCVFEKILTGIDDGVVITHGDNTVITTVTQTVAGSPLPQTVHVTAGTGTAFRAGSSYTYNGATPETIKIAAVTVNTITAVIRQNHAANQTIVNSSGTHRDIQDVIAALVTLYGAWTTPSNYLDWLAQWVALQLDPAWDEYQQRTVLSEIVGIYSQRGTKLGLDTFFDIYAIAKRRPRVVVDNDSKVLFTTPQTGMIVPVSPLVSQQPLVAPQCMAFDASGYLFVADLGSSDSKIKPALWRISPSGDYDYSAGPPSEPQPYQPAGLNLSAPIAIAVDEKYGGAYVIDLLTDYALYRLTSPQTGAVTLSGTPTAGQGAVIAIGGTPYSLTETGGYSLAQQAAAWVTTLNLSALFKANYSAASSGAVIGISPLSGVPADDLTLVTGSSSLHLTASGPGFATSAVFANDASVPPLGLKFPTAMVVSAAGHPLILDRGAAPDVASATAIVDVQVSGTPAYTGTKPHAFGAIVEPLSMLLRASGSLVVGDAANQDSAAPADLFSIDTATWTATSLLGSVPPGSNPLVAPTGIVEVDSKHLMVLDAGLRPYRPSSTSPFNSIIARQAGIYSVDLSAAPPAISLVTELKAFVYPRAMAGDGNGTLYVCDSGLPDLPGYKSRLWRSGSQQLSVLVNFPGNPASAIFCVVLSGSPTTGENCFLTIGSVNFTLAETTGTIAVQAQAWATTLNGDASFNALYAAIAVGNVISIYDVAGADAIGVAVSATSSADLKLSAGLLAMSVTLTGTPNTGENVAINVGGAPYILPETTGNTGAQQAASWATKLNATAPFNQVYSASASGSVISIFYQSADVGDNNPMSVASSALLTLTAAFPPLSIGTIALYGTPTSGETGSITVGSSSYTLTENTGNTLPQQAAAWSETLNGTPGFGPSYIASSSGGVINIFSTVPVPSSGVTLTAISSPHLVLTAYSEMQNRNRFLQSIRDVVSDEIPAHARWYLQSEQSQV
jgi:phage tail-like protein